MIRRDHSLIMILKFSVAELSKCQTTLRCWMKLAPDRFWMGTHTLIHTERLDIFKMTS